MHAFDDQHSAASAGTTPMPKHERRWRGVLAYLLLAAGMAAVLVNAVVFYRYLNALLDAGNAVRVVQHTERRIGVFLETLLNAETGQRGFVLTADGQYLRPYLRAVGLVDEQLDQLREDFAADPIQLARVETLAPLVRRKLDEMAESIAIRLRDGPEAARAFVAGNAGVADMDEIRAVLQSMAGDKTRRLAALEASYNSTREITMLSLGVFVATSIALVAALLAMIRRAERQRVQAGADHARYIEEITRTVTQIEHERNEVADVNEMASFLQSCHSAAELGKTVGAFLERSFPSLAGGLYIFAPSRNDLQLAAAFGGGSLLPRLTPEQCWGLRRGGPHAHRVAAGVPQCAHHAGSGERAALCLPLIAHGETIGLLTLTGTAAADDGVRRVADGAARHLALAIANLQLRDTLKEQSIRDPLTGTFNRRHFDIVGRKELAQCHRLGRDFALVMIDVDHFKRYNDMHGHAAGDLALVAICDHVHGAIRESDWLFRLGGEEFVLLLRETEPDDAARRCEDLRKGIARLKITGNGAALPSVTVSMGLATRKAGSDTLDDILARADEALYQSKDAGRNRLTIAP